MAQPHDTHNPIDNPFYPLRGPPQTEAEREVLQEHIRREQATLNASIQTKLAAPKSLVAAAHENCADVKWDLLQCMNRRSLVGSFTGACKAEKKTVERCVVLQTEFLTALKYHKAATDEERERVAVQADRMYLDHIKTIDGK
ncbi:hypothetical protein HDU79_005249 [Rhizoclosmatium sp. JEL0117]|nr:hypothetical protein HDU79_005249 [Rhizoclosmatium sp. JEL0117]